MPNFKTMKKAKKQTELKPFILDLIRLTKPAYLKLISKDRWVREN